MANSHYVIEVEIKKVTKRDLPSNNPDRREIEDIVRIVVKSDSDTEEGKFTAIQKAISYLVVERGPMSV